MLENITSRITPKYIIMFLLVLFLLQIYKFIFGDRGTLYLQAIEKEIAGLNQEKKELIVQSEYLKSEIKAIRLPDKKDILYEDYARENLGMIKKDELFIQLYNPKDPDDKQ